MSSSEEINLIDLSMEASDSLDILKPELVDLSFHNLLAPLPNELIVPKGCRNSLDSNPFDKMQKKVNLQNDPFEITMKEEGNSSLCRNFDVPTEDLLQIDGGFSSSHGTSIKEELIDAMELPPIDITINSVKKEYLHPINVSDCSNNSSVFTFVTTQPPNHSPISNISSIEGASFISTISNEPSPNLINLNENITTTNSYKSFAADTNTTEENESTMGMNKGFMVTSGASERDGKSYRQRIQSDTTGVGAKPLALLEKLRSTSLDACSTTPKCTSKRTKLLKLSLVNASSPMLSAAENDDTLSSSMRMEAKMISMRFADMNLTESSRSMDDSNEDLMSLNPNWVSDSGDVSDVDFDLQQMQIPMLAQLKIQEEQDSKIQDTSDENKEKIGIRLDKIKRTSEEQNDEKNSPTSNLVSMINKIKIAVEDCCDSKKQEEANILLNNLTSILRDNCDSSKCKLPPPQPIIRQGTFDVDKSNDSPIMERKEILSVRFDPKVEYSSPRNRTFRSQSLSLHDKPSSVIKAIQNKKDHEIYSTPVRSSIGRRSSFSSSVAPQARRSLMSHDSSLISRRKEDSPIKKKPSPKKPPVPRISVMRSLPSRAPVINTKKIRTKSGGIQKSPKRSGPLKALVPMRKVAPMITTRSVSSPIEDDKLLKPITSTPKVTIVNFPAACSTPMPPNKSLLSPSSSEAIMANNKLRRISYLSVTPNPKSNAQHRRSLSDFKNYNALDVSTSTIGSESKLPFMTRMSKIGAGAVSSSKVAARAPLTRASHLISARELKENKFPK